MRLGYPLRRLYIGQRGTGGGTSKFNRTDNDRAGIEREKCRHPRVADTEMKM